MKRSLGKTGTEGSQGIYLQDFFFFNKIIDPIPHPPQGLQRHLRQLTKRVHDPPNFDQTK